MAKKYNKNTSKIHPITIVSMIVFVVALILTIVLLQPSSEQKFYSTYESTAKISNSWDTYKIPENEHVIKRSSANEVISKIEAGELIIIYFSNPTSEVGASVIQDVNARLVGNKNPELENSPSKNPSPLYTEELVTQVYHVTINSQEHFVSIIDSINEILKEGTKHAATTAYPSLLAVSDKEVIADQSFSSANQSLAVKAFYEKVYKAIK